MNDIFRRFARRVAFITGSPLAFVLALLALIIWALTGPQFGFSDTWQLVINTATTIITFLMVFLIQNTQNRDSKEVHLKLDELLRAVRAARNSFIDLEDLSDVEIQKLDAEFRQLHERAAQALARRGKNPAL